MKYYIKHTQFILYTAPPSLKAPWLQATLNYYSVIIKGFISPQHTQLTLIYIATLIWPLFSVVLPTRKNYGFHLNQSTVMEQQDKGHVHSQNIFFQQPKWKNATWNLSESINSTESSLPKICSILSKCCLSQKTQTLTIHFYYC